MKKKLLALALSICAMTTMVSCTSSANESANKNSTIKVGMTTNSGTIDDKSYNQGTWEGIQEASNEFKLDSKYLQPAGTTEADYLKEIGNLTDAGFNFVVLPGFKFETAVHKAQSKYTDSKFVIIDGTPHNGDFNAEVTPNTASILFAEHESGFLAGVATAVELKEGDLGFIGGLAIPNVQRFNWGFQQGVAYANKNFGTNMSIKKENVVYSGSFDDAALGQQLAAQMYDNGVKAIFTAAAGTGTGSITEAKNRVLNGKEAWIIGVDIDQYSDGIYEGEKSVVLTSATKKISTAVYDMIKAEINGNFPGGEILTFDVNRDGVGIPENNPNLSEDTTAKVNEVVEKIKSGEITVSNEKGDLLD